MALSSERAASTVWGRRRRNATVAAGVAGDAAARAADGRGPLALQDLGRHVVAAVAARRDRGGGAAAWRKYRLSCAENGGAAPLPLTPLAVLGFALAECLRGMSARYLSGTVNAVIAYARDARQAMAGWDGDAAALVRRGVAALVADFPSEVVRAPPVTDVVMRRVRKYLAPFLARGDLYAKMWWAMPTAAYAGLLRSIEFLDGALTPSQVSVTDGSAGRLLSLFLAFRKNRRNEVDAEFDTITLPPRLSEDADLDARPAMEAYASAAGITLGAGGEPLFIRRRRTTGEPWPESTPGYGYAAALSELKWLFEAAGVPGARGFSWHGFRRGGATRLLALGVPWDVVKKLGGWLSDVAMANYDARGYAVAAAVAVVQARRPAEGEWALSRSAAAARGGAAAARRGGAAGARR